MFSQAGTTSTSGSGGRGGAGLSGAGGESPTCQLSVSDCRTSAQAECSASHPLCLGASNSFSRLSGLPEAHIVDVTTSREGRVAVTGYFTGDLRSDNGVDDGSTPLLVGATAVDAFVASFDAVGAVEWAWSYGGEGDQAGTGLDFAPNGDIVVQGSSRPGSGDDVPQRAFAARLGPSGEHVWSTELGADTTYPGHVAFDNDGVVTLVGGFQGVFDYASATLSDQGLLNVYLLRLDGNGQVISLRSHLPKGWGLASARLIVVDDEDNVIIAGQGGLEGSVNDASFVEKLRPGGEVLFTQQVRGTSGDYVYGLTVDRQMRITLAGQYTGALLIGDTTIPRLDPQVTRVWLAQLDRNGRVNWGKGFTDDESLSTVSGLTTDPFDNIAFSGKTKDHIYVQKLRPNGDTVWLRHRNGKSYGEQALAADNDANLWLAGAFTDSFDWGGGQVTARGDIDAFLLQLSP